MYPSFQRFRDASDQQGAQARAGLHAPGGFDGDEEDARDVVRSLQPLPSSARLMSASAMMRELQTRVAPQYLPSPAQQQQIQQYQLQQQQQQQQQHMQMNMQQQQQQQQQQMQQMAQRRARAGRSGGGAPAPQQQVQVAQLHQMQQAPPPQPEQYFNVDNASGTWGQMGDGLNNNITSMASFSVGGVGGGVGGGDMPVYDINGNGAAGVAGNGGAARASLNAQFLPSIHSKYRRENDMGVQEVQEEVPEMQQQQQQQPQEPEEDEQSERERMFRMRALYLQQQHAMERQKLEERQQLQRQQQEERRQLALQQQQLQQQQLQQQRRQQQQQQPQYQQSQQQLQQQQMHMQQMQHLQQQVQVQQPQQDTTRERRDLAPLATTTTSPREPDYDLPRRIHRELQPPPSSAVPQSVAGAATFAPQKMAAQPPGATAARRNVNNVSVNAPSSVASTTSGSSGGNGGGLNLPLPPPLPSTARRFASQRSPHGSGLGVNANTAAAEFASLQQPPSHAPIAPVVPAAQPKASSKASKAAQQIQIPRQQVQQQKQARVQPRPATTAAAAAQRLPVAAELRNDASMYYRDVQQGQQQVPPPPQQQQQQQRQQLQQQQQDVACCFPTDTAPNVKSRVPARRRSANEYDDDDDEDDDESDVAPEPAPKRRKPAAKRKSTKKSTKQSASTSRAQNQAASTGTGGSESTAAGAAGETKRRCGRKSMNYSSEQKRERNRAAVKKCRQRQALKYEFLLQKAEVLETENRTLSDMLVNNVDLEEEKRTQLTRGIQMDILFKIKEIFTQSLPKDFVLDADSIWDLNSVLAVSMPSRCYYGIESIKEFWRTSLRMRNKGKIRSFWAWLFRLPPGDRFTEFDIQPFSETSNLYFITWTTKSEPPLSGSMVIMFGHGHRVTLHVECFGWLIWRYLLTNEPFPEPMD